MKRFKIGRVTGLIVEGQRIQQLSVPSKPVETPLGTFLRLDGLRQKLRRRRRKAAKKEAKRA